MLLAAGTICNNPNWYSCLPSKFSLISKLNWLKPFSRFFFQLSSRLSQRWVFIISCLNVLLDCQQSRQGSLWTNGELTFGFWLIQSSPMNSQWTFSDKVFVLNTVHYLQEAWVHQRNCQTPQHQCGWIWELKLTVGNLHSCNLKGYF